MESSAPAQRLILEFRAGGGVVVVRTAAKNTSSLWDSPQFSIMGEPLMRIGRWGGDCSFSSPSERNKIPKPNTSMKNIFGEKWSLYAIPGSTLLSDQ